MTWPLVVVGGGRMGEALAGGLLGAGGITAADLAIVEKFAPRRDDLRAGLAARYPDLTVTDQIPASTGAVIAVKPGDVEAACRGLAGVGVRRVLSIAAGVRLQRLEQWLGPPEKKPAAKAPPEKSESAESAESAEASDHRAPAVLRAMPNTPALIGAGASALSAGSTAGAEDLEWASGILAAVGTVVEVPEALLDAVTGLSGSGPAYVFLLAEALTDAGVLVGLTRATAHDLAVQTLLGSARLLAESGDGPVALRAAVTSPAGTTAAGLQALESAGFRAAVLAAVVAATERSRQLGS